jgi:ribonuclease G
MKKEIIINSTLNELRIAITEDGSLAEFFIEMPDKERSIGNIYFGRVNKIVQGINAAFVNIGLAQDAFLHFSDIDESMENLVTDEDDEDDGIPGDIFEDLEDPKYDTDYSAASVALRKTKYISKSNADSRQATFRTKRSGNININLEEGQNVLVQVVREAYSSKGVRVSTKIAIPGRYTVLLPFDSMIGVSKKIGTFQERKRLRYLARTSLPEGFGCIIRTAAFGKNEDELKKDWESLAKIWREIEEKVKKVDGPQLVYQDMQLATSVIRDLFTTDVSRVIVDSKKLFKEITSYLKWASPHLVKKIELYDNPKPIFDSFGVERELETTYKRKVSLASGGSIIIDQTEAMTVVDVNTGRAMTDRLQEKNALKTNLEAIKEIARQVRLRDLSGIVLIDFIDVSQEQNRKKIFQEMKKETRRDRSKIIIYPLTQLSLMQITRQRINQNIAEKTSETCPVCQGLGRIPSKAVVLNNIERWLKKFRAKSKEFRLVLYTHPQIAQYISEGTFSKLSRLMIKYFVKIKVQQNEQLGMDQFRFHSFRRQKDITQEFM